MFNSKPKPPTYTAIFHFTNGGTYLVHKLTRDQTELAHLCLSNIRTHGSRNQFGVNFDYVTHIEIKEDPAPFRPIPRLAAMGGFLTGLIPQKAKEPSPKPEKKGSSWVR